MKNIFVPAGEKCDFFKNSANGRIMEQFCDDLKDRTVFSGSLKVKQINLQLHKHYF